MPLYPLTNLQIQLEIIQNYSRDNLPELSTTEIKDGAYIANLWYWIALYVLNNNVTYFDSFGVEYIPKKTGIFNSNKNIKASIFGTQAYNSIMYEYFGIGFIDFILQERL